MGRTYYFKRYVPAHLMSNDERLLSLFKDAMKNMNAAGRLVKPQESLKGWELSSYFSLTSGVVSFCGPLKRSVLDSDFLLPISPRKEEWSWTCQACALKLKGPNRGPTSGCGKGMFPLARFGGNALLNWLLYWIVTSVCTLYQVLRQEARSFLTNVKKSSGISGNNEKLTPC